MTTKRTMGQCMCGGGLITNHSPDCPALYPLQRQPGDEKDALTRLVAVVRQMAEEQLQRRSDALAEQALDLISEAREEHTRARDSADSDFAGLSKAISSAQPLPECNSAGGIVIRNEIESLRFDLAKATDALLTTQKRMGEVRQDAIKLGRSTGHDEAISWLREHGVQKSVVNECEDALLALYLS